MNANRSPSSELLRALLPSALDEFRFVVEQIVLRRRAGHVQIDHRLRLGCEVRRPGVTRHVTREGTVAHHLRQCKAAEAERAMLQELTASAVQEGHCS